MKIVSGKFKGKNLISPNSNHHVRPTLSKVKEALFTSLQFDIENANVLDLFCGSGALGIEALSKNAKNVIFVDKSAKSISITKQNLIELGYKLTKKHRIVCHNDDGKIIDNDISKKNNIKKNKQVIDSLEIKTIETEFNTNSQNIKIYCCNYSKALYLLSEENYKFDIIIMDPPYEQKEYYKIALKMIKELNLLNNDGVIVCERMKKTEIHQSYFTLIKTKIYGTVAVDYFGF